MYRVNVYDRHGNPLGELERASNVSRSFALNKSGSLTFDMYIDDPKCSYELLARDNVVVVWSDELEPWGGYIVDHSWQEDKLSLTCNSIEQRLGRRRTEPHKWESQYAGSILRFLVGEANRESHTGISVGTIFDGGTTYTMEVVKDNVYDKLSELMDMSKYEYSVDMVVPGVWTLSLAEKLGSDLTSSVVVIWGYDMEGSPEYRMDNAQYANRITAVGKAPETDSSTPEGGSSAISDWERRPKVTYTDWDEVGRFGLAEDTIEFNDISDKDTLTKLAREEVGKRKYPRTTVSFNINRRRGLWSQVRSGDIIQVQMPRYAFGGAAVPVRVLGREVDESAELMQVAGEVIYGEAANALSMRTQAVYNPDQGYRRVPTPPEENETTPVDFV